MPAALQEQKQFRVSDHYKPWPIQPGRVSAPQEDFHKSGARYRLEVGGYGSGKSLAMLWEGFIHGLEYPGSNSLILRKTIPDLKRTVVDKFLSSIPREAYAEFNKTDHIIYHHPDPVTGAQSKLYLSACERDADVGKFLSTEYVFIGFEELGEFSFAVWDALTGRNRCPIPGSRPCMVGVTNPMGIGWGWIKKLWVDKKPFIGMDAEFYNPADYEYFHSTVLDNPTYANNREYIQTLKASPKRGIIFEGSLDTVSGQYFENWDASRHIRFKQELIFQPWQPSWIGWDYGFGHYACMTVFTKALFKDVARLNGAGQPTLRTVNVTIGELYLHKNTPKQQAEALIALIGEPPTDSRPGSGLRAQGLALNVESIHFSWERFIKTVGDFTVADEVGDILAERGLPRPTRSNTDRVAGWQKMYDLLDTDEWFITADCPTLIESIPLLVRGDGNPVSIEDVVKPKGMSLADDMGDSCLAAGTLIDTARGLVPIEEVQAGDFALTRKGYRRVLWAGQTGVKPVMNLDSLLITPNHPVFSGGQFVTAGDTISPCLLTRKKSYLKALRIGATRTQSTRTYGNTIAVAKMDGIHSFTSKSIGALTAKCRKAVKSIMPILTHSTILPVIWLRSLLANIGKLIGSQETVFAVGNNSPLLRIGTTRTGNIAPSGAGHSAHLANTVNKFSCSQKANSSKDSAPMPANPRGAVKQGLTMWQKIVSSAASISPTIATLILGFARVDVRSSGHREDLLPARPVFNLSVEGEEEYFANGILVHNCRYAIAGALLDAEDAPESVKIRERLSKITDPMAKFMQGYKIHNEQQRRQSIVKPPSLPTWAHKLRPNK